ncbi:hypothetical protein [Winogradskyella psychrotolerans]|nr:hypothetical protein [Winogradskyella psychrotolerans]
MKEITAYELATHYNFSSIKHKNVTHKMVTFLKIVSAMVNKT